MRSTKSLVQIGHLTLPEEVGDLVSAAALEPSLTLVVVSLLLLVLGLCVGAVVATGTLVGLRVLHLPILRCLGFKEVKYWKDDEIERKCLALFHQLASGIVGKESSV